MTGSHADLWWLPVGADGFFVEHTLRWWESLRARREHRRPRPLFHAALELVDGDVSYAIEMTPTWGQPAGPRGVVASGPVGLRVLGVSRLFRYEVRCWKGGTIPDLDWAVEPPLRLPLSRGETTTLLERVAAVPRLTWGRDAFGIKDPWTSNSLVSWLLHAAGIAATTLVPPDGGSAPGWRSGITAAADEA
ncbi:MAG: hypothetical protein FWH11_07660 [Micrococcales bacterium]|nr:hypothetical protein [Micrococcales bacterium]